MVDAAMSSEERLLGNRLSAELRAIGDEIEAGAVDLQRLTGLPAHPGGGELSTARLRFSRALRRHLQHIDGATLPYLRTTSDASAKPAIDGYRRLLQDYHEAAAHHVARWPSASAAMDWDGYRRSVVDMRALLRRRIESERRDIHPLLTGKAAP